MSRGAKCDDQSSPRRFRNDTAISGKAAVIPAERILRSILLVRGEKVILLEETRPQNKFQFRRVRSADHSFIELSPDLRPVL